MNSLQFNSVAFSADVDRQVLVPMLPDPDTYLAAGGKPARAMRRRLKATRRVSNPELQPFRII
jgi:hypothetical protein